VDRPPGDGGLATVPERPDRSDEQRRSRATLRIAAALVVSTVAGLGAAGVYLAGGQPQAEGALLGLALGGLGVALVMWATHLLPPGPSVQARKKPEADPEAQAALAAEADRRSEPIGRRRVLVRLGLAAAGALGLAALFPLRSLGPRPGDALRRTAWTPGARLVTTDGRPIRADSLQVGAFVTAYPEGRVDAADSQVALVRVGPDEVVGRPERRDWSPDGNVAYSKLCTHMGCPVGLYQARDHVLLCPCHQAAFDVLDEGRPVLGPADRPLPQLPLEVDDEGFLRATDDFDDAVGPGFWDRPT
jgi:ubiquinol-cytochrome c reductase iron-sulfur subunit